MPREPQIPDLFETPGNTKPSVSAYKKYNYGTVFDPLSPEESSSKNASIRPFSFLGDPSLSTDAFGRALNLGYGRIDADFCAISPKVGSLSPIGMPNTKLVLTFVAQAFNDLQHNLTSELHNNLALALRAGPYAKMEPKMAWQSVDTEHTSLLEETYVSRLIPYLDEKNRHAGILNFDDFIKVFLGHFFRTIMIPSNIMLTRSGFSLSNRFTMLGNGLIVDLSTDNHNDDENKYNKWISHPSYNVVRDAAARHGFALDKHAPWRLVANLQSPKMLPYIQGKGLVSDPDTPTRLIDGQPIKASQVFGVFYEKIYKRDIDIIKSTVYNFYSQYILAMSYVSSAESSGISRGPCGNAYSDQYENIESRTKLEMRTPLTFEEMEQKYDDYFWLNQYFLILLAERSVDMEQKKIDRQLEKISYINKYLGHDRALTYINEYVNMMAPPLAKSLFSGASAGASTLQVTGQAAALPAPTPSGGGTTGY